LVSQSRDHGLTYRQKSGGFCENDKTGPVEFEFFENLINFEIKNPKNTDFRSKPNKNFEVFQPTKIMEV
jgi:hypothetical protein